MSCQLQLSAYFEDINKLQRYLFAQKQVLHDKEQSKRVDDNDDDFTGWDDADWGWKEEDQGNDSSATDTQTKSEEELSWLQQCHVSISPTADFMVVAHQSKLVLLTLKCDRQSDTDSSYSIIFEDNLCSGERDEITAVLCIPLASQKRSTQGGPDWTCVIVGFKSGTVNIYTENGTMLMSQVFCEEPVSKIKCRTYEPPRYLSEGEKHEELSILYKQNLVTIDGFSLFQSLRACRNHVTRATASGSEMIEPPPLAYKKWNLQDQNSTVNHISCGYMSPNAFDHMQTASMLGGYNASIKASPPASYLYVTTGALPYAAFYYAIEGSAQPMLSDVAHAMASKLKSALFTQISAASGWLGFGGSKSTEQAKEKKKPKLEPATALPLRFGLPDKRRTGEHIVISPDYKLAAITDSFGRVMLIDIHRGVATRMWKGYRDAQVGWIEVKEDSHHRRHQQQPDRHALFLVIYAPRRGILEVWTSQHGPRIAAFSVSKWCVLQCPGYKLMGLNNVTSREVKVPLPQCFLIDPQGTVKTFEVPFHLALSDKNSKRARDLHLLKKLKVHLKESNEESGALQSLVIDTLLDIKMPNIRRHGIERVLQTKYLSCGFLLCIVTAVTRQLEVQAQQCEANAGSKEPSPASSHVRDDDGDDGDDKDGDKNKSSLDYESRSLLQYCTNQKTLLNVYTDISQHNARLRDDARNANHADEQTIRAALGASNSEYESLQSHVAHYKSNTSSRVVIDEPVFSAVEYLTCFTSQHKRDAADTSEADTSTTADPSSSDHRTQRNAPTYVADNSSTDPHTLSTSDACVKLSSIASNEKLRKLCNFIFKESFRNYKTDELSEILKQFCLSPKDLLKLLLEFWLLEDCRTLEECFPLSQLCTAISLMEDQSVVCVPYNKESAWWREMRCTVTDTTHIITALMAALVGRNAAAESGNNVSPQQNVDSADASGSNDERIDQSDWVTLTTEGIHWTTLIKRLEDLLTLNALLAMKPPTPTDAPNTLTLSDGAPVRVSVKAVLDGGSGVIPEVVAKWVCSHAMVPSTLCPAHVYTQLAVDTHATIIRRELRQQQLKQRKEQQQQEQQEQEQQEQQSQEDNNLDVDDTDDEEEENVIYSQLQRVQKRLPHSLSTDVLMANCAWEYVLLWSKDPEVVFPLEQSLAFIECVQNHLLQHGVCAMMWQMFISQKVSATAFLIEKVGKAPKERLCRRDVGISDASLAKFLAMAVKLLDIMCETSHLTPEMPVLHQEDAWSTCHGASSLCHLALEQKDTNHQLIVHHHSLAVILHAVMEFGLRSTKPLSLFDTKGKAAFFKSFQSTPLMPNKAVDDQLIAARRQVLCKVLTSIVIHLTEAAAVMNSSILGDSSSQSANTDSELIARTERLIRRNPYLHWPALLERVARVLAVEPDDLRRHYVCELYSSGLDKVAEEVLLAVKDHAEIGTQLLSIAGRRLCYYIFHSGGRDRINAITLVTPGVSNWIKSLDPKQLRCIDPPMKSTAMLVSHAVNKLPESHELYSRSVALARMVRHLPRDDS